jgi:hypothetical protein
MSLQTRISSSRGGIDQRRTRQHSLDSVKRMSWSELRSLQKKTNSIAASEVSWTLGQKKSSWRDECLYWGMDSGFYGGMVIVSNFFLLLFSLIVTVCCRETLVGVRKRAGGRGRQWKRLALRYGDNGNIESTFVFSQVYLISMFALCRRQYQVAARRTQVLQFRVSAMDVVQRRAGQPLLEKSR